MTHAVCRRSFLLALFVLLSLDSQSAEAQTIGFDRDEFAAPTGTRGIVAADLNGDGWTDLATANTKAATVAVMLNRGTAGGFTLGRTVPLTGGPFDIAAGDFDEDGRIDLAVANADANTIDVLLTGAATATTWSCRCTARLTASGGPRGLTVADVDADGNLDIVYTAFLLDRVAVLYGAGDGSFSARGLPATAVGARPQGVAAADLNNDGRIDLVVANSGASPLTVLYGSASGAFTRRDVAGPQLLNVVAIGDVNGDGWKDVAAASTSRNLVAVYRGGATGLHHAESVATGSSPRGVALADLNADGRADIITANRDDSSVNILLQQSSGAFVPGDELPAGSGARAVAVADFDRDAKTDFATGNEFAGSVTVFRNSPGLTRAGDAFSRRPLLTGWDTYLGQGLVVTDLNHNGTLDVVSGRSVTLDGDPARMQVLRVPDGSSIHDVTVLDYNRDGHPDVAVLLSSYDFAAGSRFDGYYLFANNGSGVFSFVYGAGGFGFPNTIETADMNRDGWDDLLITARSASNTNQSVLYVLLNSKNGYVNTLRQTLLTGIVQAMAVGDVTADGKLDVALALINETSVTVEIGDGSGGFTNEAETSIQQPAYDLQLVDFDRDGFLDFVVTHGTEIDALKGDGRGHYSDRQIFKPTYRPAGLEWASEILIADLTDDGLADIVTDTGLVLPGTRQGSFGPPEEFEWYWSSAQAADVDSDGDLDLVVSNGYQVDVLINQRTTVNHVPIANAGWDVTVSYAYQFDAEEFYLDAGSSSDPDMHRLTYEWRENGKVLGYGVNFWPGRLLPGTHTYELTVRDERGGEAKDTVTWTITHFDEIVIYTAWSNTNGTWQTVEDGTAADGYKIWNPNAGAAKLAAPLADPVNYTDIYFTPDPDLEYKLWVRGKADGNNWANDSVFLQFSDATDAAGNPVYRIGTTSGLAVNLEECSGCGISGWGWEDDGWGAVNTPGVTLRFPVPQWQTIRVQVREDGFAIDQIVLSATKYKTQRPGKAKNDATILQRTQW